MQATRFPAYPHSAALGAQYDAIAAGMPPALARTLRAVRLENSDEPFSPFIPYRADP